MRTLDVYRRTVRAIAVGVARASMDLTAGYAKQRIPRLIPGLVESVLREVNRCRI